MGNSRLGALGIGQGSGVGRHPRAADVFALLGVHGVLLADRNFVQHRGGGLGDSIRQCSVLCLLGVLPNGVRLVLERQGSGVAARVGLGVAGQHVGRGIRVVAIGREGLLFAVVGEGVIVAGGCIDLSQRSGRCALLALLKIVGKGHAVRDFGQLLALCAEEYLGVFNRNSIAHLSFPADRVYSVGLARRVRAVGKAALAGDDQLGLVVDEQRLCPLVIRLALIHPRAILPVTLRVIRRGERVAGRIILEATLQDCKTSEAHALVVNARSGCARLAGGVYLATVGGDIASASIADTTVISISIELAVINRNAIRRAIAAPACHLVAAGSQLAVKHKNIRLDPDARCHPPLRRVQSLTTAGIDCRPIYD